MGVEQKVELIKKIWRGVNKSYNNKYSALRHRRISSLTRLFASRSR
jgi:hypothetical protein